MFLHPSGVCFMVGEVLTYLIMSRDALGRFSRYKYKSRLLFHGSANSKSTARIYGFFQFGV